MARASIFKFICLLVAIAPIHYSCISASNIFYPNSAKELNELIKSGNVVVDFYAEWCGPCKMFAPVFAKVAAHTSNVLFAKVDVDKFETPGIRSIPTIVFYKDGKKLLHKKGALTETQLRDLIKEKFGI